MVRRTDSRPLWWCFLALSVCASPIWLQAEGVSQEDVAARFKRLDQLASEHYQGGRYDQMEKVGIELRRLAEGPLRHDPTFLAEAVPALWLQPHRQRKRPLPGVRDRDSRQVGDNL